MKKIFLVSILLGLVIISQSQTKQQQISIQKAIIENARNRKLPKEVYTERHHVLPKSMGGTDDPSNLRAICSVCNEGASNLTLDRPSHEKLLIQIRRATGSDQLKVLEWLIHKFPKQSEALVQDISQKPNK